MSPHMIIMISIEALEFEQSHWQTYLDRRRPARNSPMKVWARQRVADLEAAVLELKKVAAGG